MLDTSYGDPEQKLHLKSEGETTGPVNRTVSKPEGRLMPAHPRDSYENY